MSLTTDPLNRLPAWKTIGAVDIDGLSPADAITKAGMDFTVNVSPLKAMLEYTEPTGTMNIHRQRIAPFKGRQVLWRADTFAPLGIVGDRYQVIQTADVLGMIEALVGDGWSPKWGGIRGDGQQTFLFGELPYTMKSLPEVKPIMGFFNSFDGSTALRFASLAQVPQCTNALTRSFYRRGNQAVYGFKHTTNVWNRIDEARQALGLQIQWAQHLDAEIGALIDIEVPRHKGIELLEKIIPVRPASKAPAAESGASVKYTDGSGQELGRRAAAGRQAQRAKIAANWLDSSTIDDGLRYTAWGLLQGISEMEQHANGQKPAKTAARLMAQHAEGTNGRLTATAWKVLTS